MEKIIQVKESIKADVWRLLFFTAGFGAGLLLTFVK
jgi:hypothetical protein